MADIIGTGGDDTLFGTNDPDRIEGLGGNDTIDGLGGVDTLLGGAGDDTYYVETGDLVEEASGEGFDTIYAMAHYALAAGQYVELLLPVSIANQGDINLTGNEFANIIIGSNGHNELRGGAGNDYFEAFAGNDLVLGEDGDDRLYGQDGADQLEGGAGNDYLDGGLATDTLIGGDGDDIYIVDKGFVGNGDIIIETANGGFDIAYAVSDFSMELSAPDSYLEVLSAFSIANQGDLNLEGNNRDNIIVGTLGVNILNGLGGNDQLYGFDGDDMLGAGEGQDFLFGGAGEDELYGGQGADWLDGGSGADFMEGGFDNDVYIVDDANDDIIERPSEGNFDIVYALVDYVLPASSAQIEVLSPFSIADQGALNLTGNNSVNCVAGTNGVNVIDGKGGSDWLVGHGGADTFQFTTALDAATNVDTIQDFLSGTDTIALDDAVFAGLGLGALPAGAFVTGTAAGDADDRIIYNSATGQIFFDADGNGSGAQILFASLFQAPALAASDFLVI